MSFTIEIREPHCVHIQTTLPWWKDHNYLFILSENLRMFEEGDWNAEDGDKALHKTLFQNASSSSIPTTSVSL